ncbi:ABC transporter permease [Fulvivirga lutimaris]|uniref:ABC transporter permease n=1 Tax=Fulvivirga lutimaris TaxID=1819566 RepID=UPI0012BCB657|nr:FtsX-like permease family protein [Fulvivirga lutimaris]MTI40676.1 FtsX-like permease family protein [Fulvivirga lutimaris]
MFQNYLKIAFRSVLKNRVFSIINILGLATGIAAFVLLNHYVNFENSYESFLKDTNTIYRVTLDRYANNELATSTAESYPGIGPAMKSDMPEVVDFARLYNAPTKVNVIISNEELPNNPIRLKQKRFMYADSSFLPLFGYKLKDGDVNTALAKPNTAVISESLANVYFGQSDVIGKVLRMQDDQNNDELAEITGVFEDLPENTHLKFDILFSYTTLYGRGDWAPRIFNGSWNQNLMYNYVKLTDQANPEEVAAKLPELVDKYSPNLAERNREDILPMQPMNDIHLHSSYPDEPEMNGSAQGVKAMGLIAIFILVLAWVNYVNLSTAKAAERAKEVGVRKVMGAFKKQLFGQFLLESAIINFSASVIALVFIFLVIPLFNKLTGHSFDFLQIMSVSNIGILILICAVGTVFSGIYPALVLSSFNPVAVLSGKFKSGNSGVLFRRSLVVLQFVTSIGLISATMIVYGQLQFMQNTDIGMEIDQVMVVERPSIAPKDRDQFNSSVDLFRNELTSHTSIQNVSGSLTVPGNTQELKARVKPYNGDVESVVVFRLNSMDYEFIDVFEMELLAGRNFSPDYINDTDTAVIITESASKLLGYESPDDIIGANINIPSWDWSPIVIGVVNDYNQVSLRQSYEPTMFYFEPYRADFFSMRIAGDDIEGAVSHVEKLWKKAFPENPFEYFFLDDYFNKQYANERQFGNMFASFSILAIFIGCLGLFGLSAYTAHQRTKEIGVRKVLGSKIGDIFILLSKEFIYLILIGVVIAIPVTYYFMDNWLETFAYRQSIQWWVFAIAGLAVIFVALLTVSYHTIKAATVNVINSLRYE